MADRERTPTLRVGRRGSMQFCYYASLAVFGMIGCQAEDRQTSSQKPLYYEKMFPSYTGNSIDSSTGQPKSVAVVGGGTAGLASAWNLRRLGYNVKIYETRSKLGGNVRTVSIKVPKPNSALTVNRFADAGVNDFNTKTYRYHTFMLDLLKVQHRSLEDSAMWGNTTGLFYQTDSNPYRGGAQLSPQQLTNIRNDSNYFFTHGWEVATNKIFAEFTVDQYVAWKKGLFSQNGVNCSQLHYTTGGDYCYTFSSDFINYNLKARISNMYFSDENEPGLMPIRGVLYYYILQEGLNPSGAPNPDRRYYLAGAQSWIDALKAHAIAPTSSLNGINTVLYPELAAQNLVGPPVQIQSCATVDSIDVNSSSNNKTVTWHSDTLEPGCTSGGATDGGYSYVVLAADFQGTKNVLTASGSAHVPLGILNAINPIVGDTAVAAMHTSYAVAGDGSALNNAFERTYNIYPYAGYVDTYANPNPPPQNRPYTITYIENRHQDDVRNPVYSSTPQTTFFTTLNRESEIPVASILKQTNSADAKGIKTIHQFMNTDLLLAQRKILGDRYVYKQPLQGTNGLFIGGGWIRGAGLQEECFINAVQVASQIDNPTVFVDQHVYDYTPGAARYAPLYISQIAEPETTFSGVYQGENPNQSATVCRQKFDFTVQQGHTYVISSCPAYGGSSTGDPNLSVIGNGSGCDCTNDDALQSDCYFGAQCTCTAQQDGLATICASTFSHPELDVISTRAAWNYTVTDESAGVTPSCRNYKVSLNTQYQVLCPYGQGPTVTVSGGGSIQYDPTSPTQISCGTTGTITFTANNDTTIQICTTGAGDYTVQARAKSAERASQVLSTRPSNFSILLEGPNQGTACTAPRTCPDGYVATAVRYTNNSFSPNNTGPFDWTTGVELTCKRISTDVYGRTILVDSIVVGGGCGSTSGPIHEFSDCDTGANSPAVIVGQRLRTDGVGVYRVYPLCKNLRTGQTFKVDTNLSAISQSCPADTEVISFDMKSGMSGGAGPLVNQLGFVCSNIVPLPPKNTCAGLQFDDTTPRCGGTAANNPGGCGCDSACTTRGDCCPDKALFCDALCGSSAKLIDGNCWYLGASGDSCTTTCSTHNGYNEATRTYSGSDGTDAHCLNLLGQLVSGYNTGFGEFIGVTLGCMYRPAQPSIPTDYSYRGTGTTTADASSSGVTYQRICACNY